MRSCLLTLFFCFATSAAPFRVSVPVASYCKAFAPKIKEVFYLTEHFFAKFLGPPQRQAHQFRQKGQRIRPKDPHRAQKSGKGAKKQHRAPCRSQNHKAPQLPRSPAEKKEKHRAAHRQAIAQIQHGGKTGRPNSKGTQQIIQQSGGQPQ